MKRKYNKHPLYGIRDYVSKSFRFYRHEVYSSWFAEVDKIRINFSIRKYGNKAAFEMASYAAKKLYRRLRGETLKLSK